MPGSDPQPNLDFRKVGSTGATESSKRARLSALESSIKKLPFERCFVILPNGEVWTKDGTQSSITFDPLDKDRMKDGILTHNHPASTPLSWEDIFFAVDADLAELRAVPLRGDVMKIVRPASGWPAKRRMQDWKDESDLDLHRYLQRRESDGKQPLTPAEIQSQMSRLRAKHCPNEIRESAV